MNYLPTTLFLIAIASMTLLFIALSDVVYFDSSSWSSFKDNVLIKLSDWQWYKLSSIYSIKRPVLLNDLVWIFSKSLY